MRFVIVTGMSGAGKSTALKMLEDMGYFCVDNLPIPLLPGFVQMLQNTDTEMKKVALGLDVRSGQDLSGLKEIWKQWIVTGSDMRSFSLMRMMQYL